MTHLHVVLTSGPDPWVYGEWVKLGPAVSTSMISRLVGYKFHWVDGTSSDVQYQVETATEGPYFTYGRQALTMRLLCILGLKQTEGLTYVTPFSLHLEPGSTLLARCCSSEANMSIGVSMAIYEMDPEIEFAYPEEVA